MCRKGHPHLFLPVSGSKTLLILLCCFSYSSLVMGIIALVKIKREINKRGERSLVLKSVIFEKTFGTVMHSQGGGGGTPYDQLYGEAPPERGVFLRSKYKKGYRKITFFRY